MDTIVKSAIQTHLRNSEKERNESRAKRPKGKQRLWASDVGSCARKAILRLKGYESTVGFEDASLDYMRIGIVLEDETAEALQAIYDNVDAQLVLKSDCWSGRPDFAIGHGTNDVTLIEHKVTGEKSWWNGYLPRKGHVGQIVLYGYVYEELYGIKPETILFYRGWGHFAEYKIEVIGDKVRATGVSDGVPDIRELDFDVMGEIKAMEGYYKDLDSDKLPPKLRYKKDGCTFFGKPSCQMYFHCFEDKRNKYGS